jgi:hypothetical protein
MVHRRNVPTFYKQYKKGLLLTETTRLLLLITVCTVLVFGFDCSFVVCRLRGALVGISVKR